MSTMKNATPIHHHIRKVRRAEYMRVLTLRTIGNFLILSAVFMVAKTFYQPVQQEVRYFIETSLKKTYIVTTNQQEEETVYHLQQGATTGGGSIAQLLKVKQFEALKPEDPNFSVIIPKIGANARIIPDVDVSNETEYLAALKKGVGHALGTAFPGEGGHIFLFAHSTDYFWNVGNYNAVFYLLHKLVVGDEIDLFFKGQRYKYRVVERSIVDPSQVEYLTRKTNREFVTLQTCWPPGTTLKRLLVFAVRVVD